MKETMKKTAIEADPKVPIIRLTRDFAATPAQLFRAHTDPEVFVRWVGPDAMTTTVDRWDASTGGSWRYVSARDGMEFAFHGCFHEVRPDRIVQTFTWEGDPDGVALETLDFEDLGDGRTRLHTQSLCDSFESRDGWLRSGMETGIDQGYAKLDALFATGESAEVATGESTEIAAGESAGTAAAEVAAAESTGIAAAEVDAGESAGIGAGVER